MATLHLLARAGWKRQAAAFFAVTFLFGGSVAAQQALFPEPLHLTREVVASTNGAKSIVDEYCYGNRIVSISGKRTAIADYAKGELTVIDFGAATYSIATFEELAAVTAGISAQATKSNAGEWKVEKRGSNVVASRNGETIEVERKTDRQRHHVRVTADRQMTLSRGAIEALLGLAYPNARDASADIVLGALRSERARNNVASNSGTSSPASAQSDEYRLPLEHIVRIEIGEESLDAKSVVMRVGNELPPADKVTIPQGAKRVESDAAARRRLEELDRLPSPDNQR